MLKRRTLPDNINKLFYWWDGWPNNYNSFIKETDKYNVVVEWYVSGLANKQCRNEFKKQLKSIFNETCKVTKFTWIIECGFNRNLYPHNFINLNKSYRYFIFKVQLYAKISHKTLSLLLKSQRDLYDVITKVDVYYDIKLLYLTTNPRE